MHAHLNKWWNGISLLTKITGVTVLLLTLGLLVAGVGTMSVLRNYLIEQVDAKFDSNTLDALQNLVDFSDNPCSIPPVLVDYYIGVVSTSGTPMCSLLDSHGDGPDIAGLDLANVTTHETAFTLSNARHTSQWRVVASVIGVNMETNEQVILVVGLNLEATNSLVARYAGVFLFFGLTVVVLGGALTRLLVSSTFSPLREVEDTAARFAAGDFTQRLSGGTPNTEVGRLNRSLNTMLNRIDSAFSDRAKTIDQMRRFVGDASHELRTPLVSVRGYAELYRMGALSTPEDVAQAMGRIEKEAIRMGSLVQDLLELARIDEAKPLNLAPVDLIPLAHDAALDAMASAPDRTVSVVVYEPTADAAPLTPIELAELPAPVPAELTTEPPATPGDPAISPTTKPTDPATAPTGKPTARAARGVAARGTTARPPAPRSPAATGPIAFAGATLARLRTRRPRTDTEALDVVPTAATEPQPPIIHAMVLAEENKIRQVITNLMGNALRFTDASTPIEIGVTVDAAQDSVILSISDHGEGIPPQIRDKIFQRFWRADSSRNRDTGGSGLGLAIVASIVASHNGTVDAVETPGGGATFRVRLPLLHEVTDAPEVPISPQPR
ncbi:cell wall metabolism sensor histidine kinase WalK [Glaciihabitans sp. dw_435]|uniref:sensor histidine kinase n=1 Tax=Glaciihabitans sp. dw_435 TaxID=2720081 RepID=UPI001BD44F07|nr:HAMP domain-containing sensor histidine kinase [Glaciihabitans sp. dw_435]